LKLYFTKEIDSVPHSTTKTFSTCGISSDELIFANKLVRTIFLVEMRFRKAEDDINRSKINESSRLPIIVNYKMTDRDEWAMRKVLNLRA
jgi:hypothetical protein